MRQCYEAGVEVTSLPGPAACVTALTMSGLSTRRFCFEAFLPAEKSDKKERLRILKELKDETPDDKETIADFIEEYKRQYPIHMERARLIDGALETVKYIEGLGCPRIQFITWFSLALVPCDLSQGGLGTASCQQQGLSISTALGYVAF